MTRIASHNSPPPSLAAHSHLSSAPAWPARVQFPQLPGWPSRNVPVQTGCRAATRGGGVRQVTGKHVFLARTPQSSSFAVEFGSFFPHLRVPFSLTFHPSRNPCSGYASDPNSVLASPALGPVPTRSEQHKTASTVARAFPGRKVCRSSANSSSHPRHPIETASFLPRRSIGHRFRSATQHPAASRRYRRTWALSPCDPSFQTAPSTKGGAKERKDRRTQARTPLPILTDAHNRPRMRLISYRRIPTCAD